MMRSIARQFGPAGHRTGARAASRVPLSQEWAKLAQEVRFLHDRVSRLGSRAAGRLGAAGRSQLKRAPAPASDTTCP